MVDPLLVALAAVVTFFAAPLATYCALAALVRPDLSRTGLLFFSAIGLGPMALAYLTWLGYLLAPGLSHSTYLLCNTATALIASVYACWRWRSWLARMGESWRGETNSLAVPGASIPALLLIGLLLSVVVLIFSVPMFNNDPIEYQLVAREIFNARDMAVYPLNQPTVDGLYVNASHPPGFHMLLVWSYYLGDESSTFVSRALNAFFLVSLFGCVWMLARPYGRLAAIYAVLILIAARYLDQLAISVHTDIQRLYFFLATFMFAGFAIASGRLRTIIATGVLGGAAAFSHSIGLLAAPFAISAYLLLGSSSPYRRFGYCLVGGVIAFALGGGQYVLNMFEHGVPLQDYEPVLELPQLDYAYSVLAERDLLGVWQRLANGTFQGFTRVQLFGFVQWLGVAGMALVATQRLSNPAPWQDAWLRACAAGALMFYGMLLVGGLGGIALVIKNPRYILTAAPFFAVFAGFFCAWCHRRWVTKANTTLQYQTLSAVALALAIATLVFLTTRMAIPAAVVGVVLLLITFKWPLQPKIPGVVLALTLATFAYWLSRDPFNTVMTFVVFDWGYRLIYPIFASRKRGAPSLRWPVFLGVLAILLAPVGLQNLYWIYKYAQPGAVWVGPEQRAVLHNRHYPGADMLATVQRRPPDQSRYLSFRQSDFGFYANKRWIRHIDPRLTAVYSEDNVVKARQMIDALDVKFVAVPAYMPATLFNSSLHKVLADPTWSRIELFKQSGYRLFELLNRQRPLEQQCLSLDDATVSFREAARYFRDLTLRDLIAQPNALGQLHPEELSLSIDLPPYARGTDLRLAGSVTGLHRVEISGVENDIFARPMSRSSFPVWNSTSRTSTHQIDAQFPVDNDAVNVRLFLSGTGKLNFASLASLSLCSYRTPAQRPAQDWRAEHLAQVQCADTGLRADVEGLSSPMTLLCAQAQNFRVPSQRPTAPDFNSLAGLVRAYRRESLLDRSLRGLRDFGAQPKAVSGLLSSLQGMVRIGYEDAFGPVRSYVLLVEKAGAGRLAPVISWFDPDQGQWSLQHLPFRVSSRAAHYESWLVHLPAASNSVITQVYLSGTPQRSWLQLRMLNLFGVSPGLGNDDTPDDFAVAGAVLIPFDEAASHLRAAARAVESQ